VFFLILEAKTKRVGNKVSTSKVSVMTVTLRK